MDKSLKIGVIAFVATASILAMPTLAGAQTGDQAEPSGRHMSRPATRVALETRLREQFARLDADRDGAVTQAEIEADRDARRDRMFASLDVDGDGNVSQAERDVAPGPRARPRTEDWSSADSDGDGAISRAEFDATAFERRGRTAEGDASGEQPGMRGHRRGMMGMRDRDGLRARVFGRADTDGDGRITLGEMSARPLAMFARADADGDGTVTREERRAARQARRGERNDGDAS